MKLLLLALGAWVVYRVAEENRFIERQAMLPAPVPANREPSPRDAG